MAKLKAERRVHAITILQAGNCIIVICCIEVLYVLCIHTVVRGWLEQIRFKRLKNLKSEAATLIQACEFTMSVYYP